MKVLLVTVAGLSSRFSRSLGKDCVKCLYHEKNFEESLLWRLLRQPVKFDKYIIVGGYRFEEVKEALAAHFSDLAPKLWSVYNEAYETYGSGYSLFCGMKAAMTLPFDEIVFAEGDLFLDTPSFVKVCESEKSVITSNSDPITAAKAVVYYYDLSGRVRYLYDTGHDALTVPEPFRAIYNSGQVWKFADADTARTCFAAMSEADWRGTNLVYVENYFRAIAPEAQEVIPFATWINCNTIADFRKSL